MSLTTLSMAAILALLSPHVIAGIAARAQGQNIRPPNKWFFYAHQKVAGNFSVTYSLWWGVLNSPLNGWPGLAGTANLIHSTAQSFAAMGGGYSSLQGLRHVTK